MHALLTDDCYFVGLCVGQCLVANKANLSPSCKREEERLQTVQSKDIRLRPSFKVCKEEIDVYCKDVKGGQGRIFRCLQASLMKSDFSDGCKTEVTCLTDPPIYEASRK